MMPLYSKWSLYPMWHWLSLPLLLTLSLGTNAEPAPDFTLESFEGESISLADQRGKVVMLNFWASWCAPCRKEMPLLDAMYQEYEEDGFVLLGVNVEQNTEAAKAFLEKLPVSFPILADPSSEVSRRYQVNAMPTTVVVDARGQVRHVNRGYRPGDEEKYRKQVEALLDK
ncbi:TlpA disulfide reductase family protein [Marinimicrobium sp. ARAG 43.8]|uniref:TlpA disulfide reductase family protein n=1 Tax=Marinimicrobium sp. ARAG 43.8 TaxID=3418719 RepID=UPI003CF8F62F